MQVFLSPGMRLLGRFGFARKFQVLFLLFILMTGYGTDLKPMHLREAGIAEMLLKPFQAETLGQTVHRVLSVRKR